MPTYEYACKACGEHLEVAQSFSDDPLTECPACGGALRKVFGSIGIAFKGIGFYKTDSRATSGKADSGDGKASKEPKESKARAETKGSNGSNEPPKQSSEKSRAAAAS